MSFLGPFSEEPTTPGSPRRAVSPAPAREWPQPTRLPGRSGRPARPTCVAWGHSTTWMRHAPGRPSWRASPSPPWSPSVVLVGLLLALLELLLAVLGPLDQDRVGVGRSRLPVVGVDADDAAEAVLGLDGLASP